VDEYDEQWTVWDFKYKLILLLLLLNWRKFQFDFWCDDYYRGLLYTCYCIHMAHVYDIDMWIFVECIHCNSFIWSNQTSKVYWYIICQPNKSRLTFPLNDRFSEIDFGIEIENHLKANYCWIIQYAYTISTNEVNLCIIYKESLRNFWIKPVIPRVSLFNS